ncbi:hypothetical protein ILUMI_07120 [Ignelater luminosus]|uniref:EF-hand domain-containing protein n=1 Tax=Ignelater luminosus TaxID=2038154 RepID=A0A8K0GEP4_IGNLU|nr:hypothetical protein ILUMI_07120 [Ignelater luminosus]
MEKSLPRRKSLGVGKREFTETELQDLRTAFDLLDRNQDGKLTAAELQFMLGKLGIDLSDEVVQQLLKSASGTGNELLSETEFMHWVKKIQSLLPDQEDDISKDLIAAFRVFDVEQKGYITRNELRTAMEMIGEPVTEQQLTEFIKLATTDKEGRINYEEFAKQFL